MNQSVVQSEKDSNNVLDQSVSSVAPESSGANSAAASANSAAAKSAKSSVDNYLELKPNYVTQMGMKEGSKFFYCALYFPRVCKDILRKQNPETAFIKKRDAENHVALLALKRLHLKGYLNDNLMMNMSNAKINELLPPQPEP